MKPRWIAQRKPVLHKPPPDMRAPMPPAEFTLPREYGVVTLAGPAPETIEAFDEISRTFCSEYKIPYLGLDQERPFTRMVEFHSAPYVPPVPRETKPAPVVMDLFA